MNPPSLDPTVTIPAKSSAMKAGWICLILGYLSFWIAGLGFIFFSVTIILAVVAMCTNQVKQGIVLLVSSLASLVLCAILFLTIILGTVGAAAKKATDRIKTEQTFPRFPYHAHP